MNHNQRNKMPIVSKFELLHYTPEDVENVRKYFNVDEKAIKQSVEILKNWLQQQQHLPQVVDDGFLERMLLRNKFRIEQTKKKIDDYYTLRAFYPQYFLEDYNTIVPSKEMRQILPLPKLTKSQERVAYMFKIHPDVDPDVPRCISLACILSELLLYNDYSIGLRCVVDCNNLPFNDLQNWTITRLSHVFKLCTHVYSGRLISLDLINPPTFIQVIMKLLKVVVTDKIYSRLKIHNDMESLYETIPKECLPSDLGGDLDSVEELSRKFDELFKSQCDSFNEITKQRSNEKLRIGELRKDELYGIEGNFKTLDID